jgi:hypothetical protein
LWEVVESMCGGGRGKPTQIAVQPLKPLIIRLDKVNCPT